MPSLALGLAGGAAGGQAERQQSGDQERGGGEASHGEEATRKRSRLFAGLAALALLRLFDDFAVSVTSVSGGAAEISVAKEPPAATPFGLGLGGAAEAGVDAVEDGELAGFDGAQLPDGLRWSRRASAGRRRRSCGSRSMPRRARGAGQARDSPAASTQTGRSGWARPVCGSRMPNGSEEVWPALPAIEIVTVSAGSVFSPVLRTPSSHQRGLAEALLGREGWRRSPARRRCPPARSRPRRIPHRRRPAAPPRPRRQPRSRWLEGGYPGNVCRSPAKRPEHTTGFPRIRAGIFAAARAG